LGRSERKGLRSYLEGLVLHLLKWRYRPDYRSRSWRDNIEENRVCVPEGLQENTGLRLQLPTLLQECYPRARGKARPADPPSPRDLPRHLPLDSRPDPG
jgi:Domain of unknown function DUF29